MKLLYSVVARNKWRLLDRLRDPMGMTTHLTTKRYIFLFEDAALSNTLDRRRHDMIPGLELFMLQ